MIRALSISAVCQLVLANNEHQRYVQKLIEDFKKEDINGDGYVDVGEVWNSTEDPEERKQIYVTFEMGDLDIDGKLSL